ncbi:hypothetical protein BG015_002877 [Linnemannia schmuckeri]|uniref:F-box domain-containing protein n=1 Tax=Linnemannia schmuckeri TaxID=64567 RepID=A0A9P5S9J3_9FUNG|nr:hypothetical protein BG015_002877 [Linnemannia schmuckeri]
MDILNTQSAQDDYQQIYNRDSEIYGDCVYDSHDYDDYESEDGFDDSDDDDDDYEWHDVRFIPVSSQKIKSTLSSNWPFKPIVIRKKRPIETKVIQPLLDAPELPEIPNEVLELVCGHLSQITLRSVNRVCRAWYKISERFVHHIGIWKPIEGAYEILFEQWPRINILKLWFNQDPRFPTQSIKTVDQEYLWNKFVAAITGSTPSNQDAQDDANNDSNNNNSSSSDNSDDDNNNNDSNSNSTVSPYLLHKIRHLELRGRFMSYVDHVSVFRGHLQFIQSLTITAPRRDSPIPLFTLLADFPALKSLTITMQSGTFTELSHGDDWDAIVGPAPLYDVSNIFTDEYRLEQFCLNYVCVDRRILERLIVTCPDLRVFNVKNLQIEMSPPDDGTEEWTAIAEAEENNARQRLIDLVVKHCPQLEWYSFHRSECDTSENHLKMVAQSFPEQKMHSMAFHNYSETILDALVIRDLLSRMTVLQVQTNTWHDRSSIVLNKILCMAPRLLHLLGSEVQFSTKCLWQPPAPVKPKQPFTTVGDVKRRERKEQRRARQQARTGRRYYAPPVTDTPIVDPSIPVTWQVYGLRTLELNLSFDSTVVDFTDYISRHGLFRNLVIFNLQIPTLKVGQRMIFANTRAGATAAAAAAAAVAASSGVELQLGQPLRYPNELLALGSLRCLEECTLRAVDVPGTVVPKDLKFMQRKGDFQTVSFFATRNKKRKRTKSSKKSVPKMTATGDADKVDDDEEEAEEEKLREKEKEEERWKNDTFWPVLNVFHIYYQKKLPSTDAGKIAEAFEWFRPGVDFRFQPLFSFVA